MVNFSLIVNFDTACPKRCSHLFFCEDSAFADWFYVPEQEYRPAGEGFPQKSNKHIFCLDTLYIGLKTCETLIAWLLNITHACRYYLDQHCHL